MQTYEIMSDLMDKKIGLECVRKELCMTLIDRHTWRRHYEKATDMQLEEMGVENGIQRAN